MFRHRHQRELPDHNLGFGNKCDDPKGGPLGRAEGADSKLLISYLVGGRHSEYPMMLMDDRDDIQRSLEKIHQWLASVN